MDLVELKAVSQANSQAIAQATQPFKRIIYTLLFVIAILIASVGVGAYKFVSLAFDSNGENSIVNNNTGDSFISSKIGG